MTAAPGSGSSGRIGRRTVLVAGTTLGLWGLAGLAGGCATGDPDHRSRRLGTTGSPVVRAVPALALRLLLPAGVAVAPGGAVYLADSGRHCVWRLDGQGRATIVAGQEDGPGFEGDGGPAVAATLRGPAGLALALDGTLFIADSGNHRIRRVAPDGIITTVAGTGAHGFDGDGAPATRAALAGPLGLAVGADGALVIADTGNHRLRRVAPNGVITTIAGDGGGRAVGPDGALLRFGGNGGPAVAAHLNWPADVAIAPDGAVLIADTFNGRIRRLNGDGRISTVAGGGESGALGDHGPAGEAELRTPLGLAVGPAGELVIADTGHHRLRRVDASGRITTIAGRGDPGFGGDGGPARQAALSWPTCVAWAADGALLIADRANRRLRRMDGAGQIATIAGNGAMDPTPSPPPVGVVTE